MLVDDAYEVWVQASGDEKGHHLPALHEAVKVYAVRFILRWKREYIPDLADDIAHDVLIGLHSFTGDAKFRTWVGAFIRNHWTDYVKRQMDDRERFVRPRASEERSPKNVDELDSGIILDREVGNEAAVCQPEDSIINRIRLSQLESRLNEPHKAVYERVFRYGMSQREAAQQLGKHLDAVESVVRRIRKVLGALGPK